MWNKIDSSRLQWNSSWGHLGCDSPRPTVGNAENSKGGHVEREKGFLSLMQVRVGFSFCGPKASVHYRESKTLKRIFRFYSVDEHCTTLIVWGLHRSFGEPQLQKMWTFRESKALPDLVLYQGTGILPSCDANAGAFHRYAPRVGKSSLGQASQNRKKWQKFHLQIENVNFCRFYQFRIKSRGEILQIKVA